MLPQVTKNPLLKCQASLCCPWHPLLVMSCCVVSLSFVGWWGQLRPLMLRLSGGSWGWRHLKTWAEQMSRMVHHVASSCGFFSQSSGWILNFIYLFLFIFLISWRLITLQYCSGFCQTLAWISLGYTCIPHPDPPSHLPLHPIPLGLPSAPGPSTCLMHPTWADDLFHPR